MWESSNVTDGVRAPSGDACFAVFDVTKAYRRRPSRIPGERRDFAGISCDQHVTFGSFRFEPASARLWDNGAEVKLTRKAAMVLGALLERPGAPVSKQELFANVWRGTVVSDDALVTCIQELRKALGDDSKQPLYIETRHRLGYRFAAPVETPAPVAPRCVAARAISRPLPFCPSRT